MALILAPIVTFFIIVIIDTLWLSYLRRTKNYYRGKSEPSLITNGFFSSIFQYAVSVVLIFLAAYLLQNQLGQPTPLEGGIIGVLVGVVWRNNYWKYSFSKSTFEGPSVDEYRRLFPYVMLDAGWSALLAGVAAFIGFLFL